VSEDLLELTHDFLVSLCSSELEPFMEAWPSSSLRRLVSPATLPVLRWITQLESTQSVALEALVREIRRVAGSLAWRQSYDVSQVGAPFLDSYGWAEVVGLTGEMPCESLACGFLFLGPQTLYPPHRHEAEEIYIPLSGTAAWQKGQEDWCEQPPLSIIHHARYEPHSMRTARSALLALYLWRSDRLEQKSQLDRGP
jgi:hypothetical protein